MSVLIYGVDDHSEKFCTVPVSSEARYHSLWHPIIQKLGLTYIGDQRWLFRKDLPEIISEFQQVAQYMKDHRHQYSPTEQGEIEDKVKYIVEHLEEFWNEVPEAERLWMG